MRNMGVQRMDVEAFKQSYDSDPRIKNAIKSFDRDGINFVDNTDDISGTDTGDADKTVDKMAKRASSKALN